MHVLYSVPVQCKPYWLIKAFFIKPRKNLEFQKTIFIDFLVNVFIVFGINLTHVVHI